MLAKKCLMRIKKHYLTPTLVGSDIVYAGGIAAVQPYEVFFRLNFDFKNECQINLIITKNHAADPEKGFVIKSISKPYGRETAMPLAWELKY